MQKFCFMRRFLFIILTICFTLSAFSQKELKLLKVEDMHSDLDYFYTNLIQTHPYPYRVISQQEWEKKIDSLKSVITTPLTVKDYYLLVSELNSYLDAHSKIAAPKKVRKKMKNPLVLPVFEEDGEKVYFLDSLSNKFLLTTLDGKTPQEIRNFCDDRYSLLEPLNNPNFLNYVRNYCNITMVQDSVKYTYSDTKGNTYVSFFKRDKKKDHLKISRETNFICDSTKSVALMEVNTFMPTKGGYRSNINDYFSQLKQQKIKRLYIDVSCNGGGSLALVNWLVGFFIDNNETTYAGTWTQKFSKQRRTQKLDWLAYNEKEGYIQRKSYIIPTSSKPKYKGEVFVIQSRNSFSGAAIFSSLMQTYVKRCKIVGEEGEVKAFFADPLIFTMPKSKLQFTLSSMFGRFAGKNKERGAVPDIEFKIYDPQQIFTIEEVEQMIKQ